MYLASENHYLASEMRRLRLLLELGSDEAVSPKQEELTSTKNRVDIGPAIDSKQGDQNHDPGVLLLREFGRLHLPKLQQAGLHSVFN